VSYYRRSYAPVIWGVAIALALAAALVFAHRATVAVAVAAERAAVLADGASLLALSQAHSAAIRRERDSLRAVVARVDTVLVSRLRTVRDTAWLPADASPVVRLAACRATLDTLASECAQFRASATLALAAADSLAVTQSDAARAAAWQLAAITRSRDAAQSQLAARGKWRAFERGVCAGSIGLNVFSLTR
jgi:hypothetical protein